MIWEYLVLFGAVAWALFYLGRTLFSKKGCSCHSCPLSKMNACQSCIPENPCQHQEETEQNK